MSTIVVTYIYNEFWGTREFKKSCQRIGLPIYNAFNKELYDSAKGNGVGSIMKMLGTAHKLMVGQYDNVIYSDGADTVFLKAFTPPPGKVIISVEKALWPPTPDIKHLYPPCATPWKYVNAGNLCGPAELMAEFYERYGLNSYENIPVNGQLQVAEAFLQGLKDGFPVELDTKCEYFQTTAFEDPGDFYSDGIIFKNMITGTEPCVLHGNGRTDMKWIYENLNK